MKNNWTFKKVLKNIDKTVKDLNTSKVFTGLMIITLNIGSRFVNLNLSKSMESYLKYTFSKQILIFAIIWMGTRDIYSSFVLTAVFIFLSDYLFNEDSKLCVIPEKYRALKDEIDTNKDGIISTDELNRAIELIKIANNKMAAKL